MKRLYLNNLFFLCLALVAVLFVVAFFLDVVMGVATVALMLLIALLGVDVILLFRQKQGLIGKRVLPEKLSNGDKNFIQIQLKNKYPFKVVAQVLDEVPFQFQLRDFTIEKKLKPFATVHFDYPVYPKARGTYSFGRLNIFVKTPIGLVSKRYISEQTQTLPAYPSFIHLRKYELMALKNEFLLGGIKKIRKIGHTMEFEQIKEYVVGDDIRTINWKATGKHNQLMVNQYQEERAQQVYLVIDKGRTMKMPFDGMSLLDYSINASMALAHIILKKHDRVGMMTFSDKIENSVAAELKSGQLKKIAEALYNIQTNFFESDFNRLYVDLRHKVSRRSLILLFTNFETLDALHRQLKYLRAIAKNHLVVIVFFRNPEVMKLLDAQNTQSLREVYDEIIAEKFEYEKKLIRRELRKYGIYSVYTLPENLNISVINKYLEIKARDLL